MKNKYKYFPKRCVMWPNELQFYRLLRSLFGVKYEIIPQVHLDELAKPSAYNWLYWFRRINQKSVDFVMCDLSTMEPLVAIELDDRSHLREQRIHRDEQVQKVLHEAHIPLVRFKKEKFYDPTEVKTRIGVILDSQKT